MVAGNGGRWKRSCFGRSRTILRAFYVEFVSFGPRACSGTKGYKEVGKERRVAVPCAGSEELNSCRNTDEEDKVGLAIRARKSLFALEITRDDLRIPKGVHRGRENDQGGRKVYPLVFRGNSGQTDTEQALSILNRGRLDGADDAFLKVSRFLLHDNNGLLECILFIELLMELTNDGKIGDISG
jgi:hypothetical protein